MRANSSRPERDPPIRDPAYYAYLSDVAIPLWQARIRANGNALKTLRVWHASENAPFVGLLRAGNREIEACVSRARAEMKAAGIRMSRDDYWTCQTQQTLQKP